MFSLFLLLASRCECHSPAMYGNHFEGDIVQRPTNRIDRGVLRGFKRDWRYRWSKVIQYEIGPDLYDYKSVIKSVLDWISSRSCLTFIKGERGDRIKFSSFGDDRNNGNGCWSYVGRQGGEQVVNLAIPGCVGKGTVFHEVFHALGKVHEQTRPDRDDYVEVLYENIEPKHAHNFAKSTTAIIDTAGTRYDTKSIMHYSSMAFSKNGNETIRAKNRDQSIGRGEEPTWMDMYELNHAYRCPPPCPDPNGNICPSEKVFFHRSLGREYKTCSWETCRGFAADLAQVQIGERGTGGKCEASAYMSTQYSFCCAHEEYFTNPDGSQKSGVRFPRCDIMID